MEQLNTSDQYYFSALSRAFDSVDEGLINDILKGNRILHFQSGDILFKQGALDNAMYIVLSGRFRVIAEIDGSIHKLGDVKEAEPIGEFSLFNKEPRMATAHAMRPSAVLEINEKDYFKIIADHPMFAAKLTSVLLKRMKSNNLQNHLQVSPKNIAIINLQPNNDLSPWTEAVKNEFEESDLKFNIYDQHILLNNNFSDVFETIENNEGFNFLVCNENDNEWTRKSLIYADLIIVATDFYASTNLYEIERMHNLYQSTVLNKKIYLLLLHPENAKQPINTNQWFDNRKFDLHIHYRKNNLKDTSRFCRIITNRAIGLVLGGGGSKGFAHIGAVKALMAAGVPIDFLGGTSAGALYGLPIAFFDFDFQKIDFTTQHSANKKLLSHDLTIPFISLLSGKKIANHLKEMLGTTNIEDFWISTYCVSSNFTKASICIHNSGMAWQKILASMAIPGVFPPVIIDKELHVDGGVIDNLPIKPMYAYPVSKIISIALSGLSTQQIEVDNLPTASSILWNKIVKRKRLKLPGISAIIINSLTLNSSLKQEQYKSEASLYIQLDLKGYNMLDDTKWRAIMDKGYDQMSKYLRELSAEQKFWLIKNT